MQAQLIRLNNVIADSLNKTQLLTPIICRLWLAKIFFLAGLTKIANWDQTILLFEYEYAVPILPVSLAALLATVIELSAPILLILGLLTRYSAFALLIMTLVIQFAVIPHDQHYSWMLMCFILISNGGGKFSLDNFIKTKFFK
ncbi:MAG: DoxX family protein [Rickettsiales bacterium]|nr:DoxX family protein [Rickettsiales bacterium]